MSNHATPTRQASLADVQQVAQVFAAGFIDDDVFGRFMHPKRREYPADWLRYWQREIKQHLVDASALLYVRTDASGIVKGCCAMRRLGQGTQAEDRASSASLVAGDNQTDQENDANWIDRSADPEAIAAFERNWEDIKHHFCGPRAECWMIELLCVAPDAQKSGYGRELIHAAIALCQAENPMVPLCVIASETGDGFYEKLGFREVGRANVGELSGVRGGSLKFYEEHLDRGNNTE
ncbi:hypothetical protein DV736_g2870, partial [Chaetothyriales sp. CBS 134916]